MPPSTLLTYLLAFAIATYMRSLTVLVTGCVRAGLVTSPCTSIMFTAPDTFHLHLPFVWEETLLFTAPVTCYSVAASLE